jgi:xanthine/uracil permease
VKLSGIIIALIGGSLLVWHMTKVLLGTDYGSPPLTHHWTSLIGGVVLFIGIWIYTIGRRRARRAAGTPIE